MDATGSPSQGNSQPEGTQASAVSGYT